MPWPANLAAKIISKVLKENYGIDQFAIRRFDTPMASLPFFNNSATPAIRKNELILVAGAILKGLEELQIPLEDEKLEGGASPDDAKADAMEALATAMNSKTAKSSKIVKIVDEYYQFRDED